MTLYITEMKYHDKSELVEHKPKGEALPEKEIGQLIRDVLQDFRTLSRDHRVYSGFFRTMMPRELEDMIAKELTNDKKFLYWLTSEVRDGYGGYELLCQPRTAKTPLLLVDFYDAWPINSFSSPHATRKNRRTQMKKVFAMATA